MRQAVETLACPTRGKGLYEITPRILAWLAPHRLETGLLTVFCRHTSASLIITENASPPVRRDLMRFLDRLAPEGDRYGHAEEGPDDMPAHLRAVLTQTSLSIPIAAGRPVLGTWQGVFLIEHRAVPHSREIVLHTLGD